MKKLLLSAVACATAFTMSAQVTTYSVGQTVADFTVTDTDGTTWNLYTITATGKYVFLDFFFDTCGPCQATQTYYNELHEKYGCNDGDIFVISINNGTDNDAMVIAYENTYGGPYEHAPAVSSDGGGGTVTSQFGVGAFPTYCIIAPDNTLANADIWPISDVTTFEAAFPVPFSTMSCATDVEEEVSSSFLNLYPNPADDVANVVIDLKEASSVELSVYNILGELVYSEDMGDNFAGAANYELNTSDLENGNYMVSLLIDGVETDYIKFTVAR